VSGLGNAAQRRHLAGELKRLRLASALSGAQMASHLKVTQPTISRIETGRQKVSLTQVSLWASATGATPEREAELLELAGDILAGPRSWAQEDGGTDAQRDLAELEQKTGLRSEFEPAVIPGLLQTAAYAARVISSGPEGVLPDVAQRVMNRMSRQRILYDEAKRFRFVIPEAVLLSPFGSAADPDVPGEHREQLGRVEAATVRPNVEIGILPLAASPVWRLAGFSLYDDIAGDEPLVHVEWLTRPIDDSEPDQVEMCRQAFANLMHASAVGDDARELIRRAIDSLR
jgi:transcriptional regulator with XRE-family HTH domain